MLKLNLFDDNNFINIPLKDFDAEELGRLGGYPTNYVDGGLMLFDELFENYKNQRLNYQCFTNFEANPDAHQVSNLKSLYESLFNVLIDRLVIHYSFHFLIAKGSIFEHA